jgi:hypothetical protein
VFLLWRWWAELPSLNQVYTQYWLQTTGLPGVDLLRAINALLFGGSARPGDFNLWFDIFCAFLLIAGTLLIFRRLPLTYGFYSALLLLFIMLPASELKPLYSFSRYLLAFFPVFMLLAQAGQDSWRHRLILYSSLILYLWFSGQFFLWGWVA